MESETSIDGAEEQEKRLRLLRKMIVAETVAASECSGCPCVPEYLAMVSSDDWKAVAALVRSDLEALTPTPVNCVPDAVQHHSVKESELQVNDPLGAMFA